jgi:hypothetical protein
MSVVIFRMREHRPGRDYVFWVPKRIENCRLSEHDEEEEKYWSQGHEGHGERRLIIANPVLNRISQLCPKDILSEGFSTRACLRAFFGTQAAKNNTSSLGIAFQMVSGVANRTPNRDVLLQQFPARRAGFAAIDRAGLGT